MRRPARIRPRSVPALNLTEASSIGIYEGMKNISSFKDDLHNKMPRPFTWHSFVVGAEGSGFKYRPGDNILTEGLCSSHSFLAIAAVVPQIRARHFFTQIL